MNEWVLRDSISDRLDYEVDSCGLGTNVTLDRAGG